MKKIVTKKIALSGILLAFALILSVLEGMLPPIIPVLPYAKIGLGNVILLACFLLVGVVEGYVVLLLKCLLSAVFAGNMSILIWSLPSALLAYTAMILLSKVKLFSTCGLSIVGGMLHNFTQIAVASIVTSKSVFIYLPYMLLAGGIAGLVTGIVCHFCLCAVDRGVKRPKAKRRFDSFMPTKINYSVHQIEEPRELDSDESGFATLDETAIDDRVLSNESTNQANLDE